MALVVEDGSGLANAEAYASVAQLRAYAGARGVDVTARTDEACEVALRLASTWIDTRWRFKAARLRPVQSLEFPRNGLVDWSGYVVVGVPPRVVDATCELALRAVAGTELAPDQSRADFVRSETVGPISTTYADGAPSGPVFTLAERMLQPFIRDPEAAAAGFFGGGTSGAFNLGMHRNTG